ncbi:MAG: acyltransferase [Eubacteriales bacterium]
MTDTSPPSSARPAQRDLRLDALRMLACAMVVLMHSSAQNWYILSPQTSDWVTMHLWNTLTRSAVPLFFMLSGALFLNGAPPGRKLWTRNIPRLLSVYVVWSILYGIDNLSLPGLLENPLALIGKSVEGHYHLWFLPAMIGVYVLMPFLYAIVHYDGGRYLPLYLLVFGFFGIVCGTVLSLSPLLPWSLSTAFQKIVPELCGYAGYFILGYALSHVDTARVRRLPLCLVFLAAVALTAAAGIAYSRQTGAPSALLCEEFTLPTCAEAVSLFLFFRTLRIAPECRFARLLSALTPCTLGVYLLHPFLMEHLRDLGVTTLLLPAWAGVPLIALLCLLLSMAVSALLIRIPYLGRWIA